MAASLIPDELWQHIEPLLPTRPATVKGGRPPVGDREVLRGSGFVLRTGIPWEELPQELGWGCGMTCLRRLRGWQEAGVWQQIQPILQQHLRPSRPINWGRLRSPDQLSTGVRTRRACGLQCPEPTLTRSPEIVECEG
ncbi:MAG: transposase [Planctomycetes bacterium]|nr:transposase [Planctomycetota bacterium]